jgi:hypothetical protein
MTSSTVAGCLLVAILAGCRTEADRRGPLASIADTVMRSGLQCVEVNHWPMEGAQSPFQDCRGSVLDTSVFVVTDAQGTVITVGRKWLVGTDDTRNYAALRRLLQATYGPGISMPPPSEDNYDRRMTVWRFGGHYLELRLMPSESTIYLSWWKGTPDAQQ